ncbi:uncharacterized protein [Oryctolagus cuniculus]|uniref:uncharacterized protein n=1 Tax=Oryctolagus cuniculus TaxID=9986 RepID=UPI003879E176
MEVNVVPTETGESSPCPVTGLPLGLSTPPSLLTASLAPHRYLGFFLSTPGERTGSEGSDPGAASQEGKVQCHTAHCPLPGPQSPQGWGVPASSRALQGSAWWRGRGGNAGTASHAGTLFRALPPSHRTLGGGGVPTLLGQGSSPHALPGHRWGPLLSSPRPTYKCTRDAALPSCSCRKEVAGVGKTPFVWDRPFCIRYFLAELPWVSRKRAGTFSLSLSLSLTHTHTHTHTPPELPPTLGPLPRNPAARPLLACPGTLPGNVKRIPCREFHKGVFSPYAQGYKTHLKISVSSVPLKTATIKYRWFLPVNHPRQRLWTPPSLPPLAAPEGVC